MPNTADDFDEIELIPAPTASGGYDDVTLTPIDVTLEPIDVTLTPVRDVDAVFDAVVLQPLTILVNPTKSTSRSSSRRKMSKLVAGIDEEIRRIFLQLPEKKLRRVFQRYGREFGISKLIYAKNTYPRWKSGEVEMSGVVVARLLNLVPAELDASIQYELVKRLRSAYQQPEHVEVSCDQSNWFKRVPKVVDALINNSRQFQLPAEVTEKLNWLMNGDAVAAHELLAAAEVEEAQIRTQFLEKEYALISQMLTQINGVDYINHTIELPQGTIAVRINRSKIGLIDRLSLAPARSNRKRRSLSVICKNPSCGAEFETKYHVYQGEPIAFSPGQITCSHCGSSHEYDDRDLSRARQNLHTEIRKGIFGNLIISYDCPLCGARLQSPLDEAGTAETCPNCESGFIVPSM